MLEAHVQITLSEQELMQVCIGAAHAWLLSMNVMDEEAKASAMALINNHSPHAWHDVNMKLRKIAHAAGFISKDALNDD